MSNWSPTKPRGPIAASFSGPGPSYALPSCLGNKTAVNKCMRPSYSFGTKHRKFSDDCSPGPCHFIDPKVTNKGHAGEPHYSLYSRSKDMTQFKTPGPGTYSPEKSGQMSHFHAPCYSLRSRTRGVKFDKTPAPNSYSLPNILGGRSYIKPSLPIYSLTGRSKIGGFSEDLQQTPGPGTYNTTDPCIYKQRGPIYSMTARNQLPSDSTRKPGPGQHSPEKVFVTKKKAPEFSFGIRHTEFLAPNIVDCADN